MQGAYWIYQSVLLRLVDRVWDPSENLKPQEQLFWQHLVTTPMAG